MAATTKGVDAPETAVAWHQFPGGPSSPGSDLADPGLRKIRGRTAADFRLNAQEYHLGPGDQVRVLTFGEEQLTGEFRVNARGDIALPLVGNVHAAGLTPDQLEGATKEVLIQSKCTRTPVLLSR